MEASLLKLQQMRKKATSDKDGKMSDDEKIRQQIRLDVAAFGEKIFELGVDRENSTFKSLHELAHSSWEKGTENTNLLKNLNIF